MCGAIVTYNGIDDVFRVSGSEDRSHFLFVGNDKPHKNIATLLDAFASVRAEMPQARLVLVGAAFNRLREREGIDARGFVPIETLASLYRSAIALVMPSIEEGFGLPAAEAMASGAAVITSNAASLVEITGDAAMHVDALDARALADAMLRVARDASLRDSLSARGVERAKLFTWMRCATLTRDVYRSV
jgi:glycosyltransferase involved in cell wall biosynthesis